MGGAALPLLAGGSLLNAIGNQQGPSTGVAVPPDLRGARGSQIDLLQYLLGPTPGGAQGQGAGATRTPAAGGEAPGTDIVRRLLAGIGGGVGAGGGAPAGGAGSAAAPMTDPLSRLQSYFGPLGVPQTDLQRQSAGNLTSMLNANAPGSAQNVLQGMLTGTGPQFERDIASANQQGPRFGSANEILRGEALRNLFNMRTQTAGALGALNQQGFATGQQQASQADVQTQRVLQLLGGLLGLRQQATMEAPVTQTPNAGQAFGGAAMGLGSILPFLGGGSGGGAGGGGYSFDPSIIAGTFG